MSLYAIGDVQGCYASLRALLEKIDFAPERDELWFAGDLVNRGPESLETLRFIRALGDGARCVLGNHDIYFLKVADGLAPPPADGALDALLAAPDRDALADWLRRLPLLIADDARRLAMVHAGLPPQWSIADAAALAAEAQAALAAPGPAAFLEKAWGDSPDRFTAELAGADRLRAILNALTRLRYCDAEGRMALAHTGPPGSQPPPFAPWFEHPHAREPGWRVLFGHWSTLGFMERDDVVALDSGCLWGGRLTAYRLDAGRELAVGVDCPEYVTPPEKAAGGV